MLLGSCTSTSPLLVLWPFEQTAKYLLRYLLEHGLTPEGRYDDKLAAEVGAGGSYDTFFTETSGGKYVPRSVFVDLDPSVCNPISGGI